MQHEMLQFLPDFRSGSVVGLQHVSVGCYGFGVMRLRPLNVAALFHQMANLVWWNGQFALRANIDCWQGQRVVATPHTFTRFGFPSLWYCHDMNLRGILTAAFVTLFHHNRARLMTLEYLISCGGSHESVEEVKSYLLASSSASLFMNFSDRFVSALRISSGSPNLTVDLIDFSFHLGCGVFDTHG